MKCSLGVSNFLEEISSLFPFYCFPLFLCIDHQGRLSHLSLLFFGTAFKWVYLSFSPLPFASLLFTGICKASSDNHLTFLHFFFLGMVLIPASCTVSWTSIHSSSGTLSDLIAWIYFSRSLYNHKGGCGEQQNGSTLIQPFVSEYLTGSLNCVPSGSAVSNSLRCYNWSLPRSSVHGIFQAGILMWAVIPFSRRSSRPRDWTQVSSIVGRRFTILATREI